MLTEKHQQAWSAVRGSAWVQVLLAPQAGQRSAFAFDAAMGHRMSERTARTQWHALIDRDPGMIVALPPSGQTILCIQGAV